MGRPRIYSDEEMRERRKMHRANWVAKNPDRNAEAKRRWFERHPGYRTQWARDKRAERREDQATKESECP
ncbi:MAG TPA: hypothetical protein VGO52_20005 [Hyphomonadaceae bacterium]|jgi:hypothetical protein|nr:hypothetical protein [Hyphomonadaceae bacterium]